MILNIKYASESCWHEVCKKVDQAIVFIDDYSAECLHWHGGVMRLHQNGALVVKDFSSFENGGEHKKAVFIISSPLVGPPRIILRDLISSSKFNHCILVTSCSPVVLNVATTGNVPENSHEMTAVHKLELDMLRWMKNKEYTAEIFHLPISVVPITNYFFAMPPFKQMFPCFTEDLEGKTIYSTLPRNLDLEALPLELQIGVLHLMTSINSLLSQLSVKETIYCMGILSSLVGSQLQKHTPSALRLKTATNNMSLILIDRTLDLCGVMNQGKDVLLDTMKSVLPPFPDQSIDVAINMSPVCCANSNPDENYITLAPGCLHDPQTDLLDWFITKKPTEILLELYNRFSSVSKEKNLTKINPKGLMKIVVEYFGQDYDKMCKHSGLLQYVLGATEALTSPNITSLEFAEGLTKLLFQSISANNGTNDALIQLREMVMERHKNDVTVETLLSITVLFYSLVGQQFEINPTLEKELREAFVNAIEEDANEIGCIASALESFDKSQVETFSLQLFSKLNSVRKARMSLNKYKELAVNYGPSQPIEYNSLISQLICDIVDVTKPDISDLRYKANISLRDNFTSRFSMILNASRPHVMDNDIIMIFVIGGITAQEVKLIKDCFKAYNKEVIVGSTLFASSAQITKNLFTNDPLKPFVI